jgi:hypothetical protein
MEGIRIEGISYPVQTLLASGDDKTGKIRNRDGGCVTPRVPLGIQECGWPRSLDRHDFGNRKNLVHCIGRIDLWLAIGNGIARSAAIFGSSASLIVPSECCSGTSSTGLFPHLCKNGLKQ